MKTKPIIQTLSAALAAILLTGILPVTSFAQGGRRDRDEHQSQQRRDRDRQDRDRRSDRYSQQQQEAQNRQKTKNDWRNLATAAGGIAALGILKKDPTIAFAGAAGALYSLNRYEQDRKSQSNASRARASVFSQPYVYRDGQRYERRLVTQNGQKYYRFERR